MKFVKNMCEIKKGGMIMKKLGFGFMRLPLNAESDFKNIDMEQVKKMVDRFMERGFNYFDTAYPYHEEKVRRL